MDGAPELFPWSQKMAKLPTFGSSAMMRVSLLSIVALLMAPWLVEGQPGPERVGAVSASSVREWSTRVDGLLSAEMMAWIAIAA